MKGGCFVEKELGKRKMTTDERKKEKKGFQIYRLNGKRAVATASAGARSRGGGPAILDLLHLLLPSCVV